MNLCKEYTDRANKALYNDIIKYIHKYVCNIFAFALFEYVCFQNILAFLRTFIEHLSYMSISFFLLAYKWHPQSKMGKVYNTNAEVM